MSKNRISLSNLLLWFRFDHFAQPKSHAIEGLDHRVGHAMLFEVD
jgi:hypothetical protein